LTRVKGAATIAVVEGEPTRERILSAAWRVARERGSVEFTLAEIAAQAGVSRQALYLHFDNRAGLLVEMARRIDHGSGFVTRVAATRKLPALKGFRQVLRLWYDHLAEILPVARALEAAAITGAEGSTAYHDRMRAWRETLRISVAALADGGHLRREWTVDHATDWVWMRTQPANYEYLVSHRHWPAATATQRLIRSILAELTTATAPRVGHGSAKDDARS
jgi:AcrR family transcriptional regulator